MAESLVLKWKRPETLEYPKVWHTFKARDLDSDELVEYRIQDLPLERIDDVLDFMLKNYIVDEPIGQVLGMFVRILVRIDFMLLNSNSFSKAVQRVQNIMKIIKWFGMDIFSRKSQLYALKPVPMKLLV